MLNRLKEIYNKEFCTQLDKLNAMTPEVGANLDLQIIEDIYNVSIKLLKTYLNYNGIFPGTDLGIIKLAYYNEIIDDGQKYIDLYYYIKQVRPQTWILDTNKINTYIFNFNKLSMFIKKELEQYER